MTQEKKYSRNYKYNYLKAVLCEQSDKVFRKCYTCQQWKPLDNDNYLRNEREVMWFTFQCKDCRNAYKKQRKEFIKEQIKEQQKEIKPENVKQEPIFEDDSVESKLDRILSYLWLNKWAFKKS